MLRAMIYDGRLSLNGYWVMNGSVMIWVDLSMRVLELGFWIRGLDVVIFVSKTAFLLAGSNELVVWVFFQVYPSLLLLCVLMLFI